MFVSYVQYQLAWKVLSKYEASTSSFALLDESKVSFPSFDNSAQFQYWNNVAKVTTEASDHLGYSDNQ